jgi:transcriptional regulator with XRE-family HTH domain
MPPRIGYKRPKQRRRTFFKQWRLHRGLSQERLAERLETSVASISRIESGRQPYTQDFLEALAVALQTDPASLLMRDPSDPEAIWSIWDNAKQGERKMILDIARTIVKTGT